MFVSVSNLKAVGLIPEDPVNNLSLLYSKGTDMDDNS